MSRVNVQGELRRAASMVLSGRRSQASGLGPGFFSTGPAALTYDECAAIMTEVLGRPIRYADPSPWSYWRRVRRAGMPRGMAAVTIGIYTAARLGLAAGLSDDVARLAGRAPIDFATFAHDHAAAWRRPEDRVS